MTGNFVPRIGGNPAPGRLAADGLTRVELTWIEKRIEHWIRFGRKQFDADEGSDIAALRDDHISVTPLKLDLTAHEAREALERVL